jgi:hypothetical protein
MSECSTRVAVEARAVPLKIVWQCGADSFVQILDVQIQPPLDERF